MKDKILVLFIGLVLCMFAATTSPAFAAEKPADVLLKGTAYNDQGLYEKAEPVLKELADSIAPDHPDRQRVAYELGRSLLGQGKGKAALALITPYAAANPGNGNALYNAGLAHLISGNPGAALLCLEKAAKADPALVPESLFYQGIVHMKQGRRKQAYDVLSTLVKTAPDSEPADRAKRIIAEMIILTKEMIQDREIRQQALVAARPKTPTAKRPWRFSAIMGLEYDDNVLLIPDSTDTLPQGVSSKEAWRVVYGLGGSYEFLRRDGHRLLGTVNYGGTENRHLSDFNVDNISFSLPWQYIKAPFRVSLSPRVSYTWVGDERYAWAWGIVPGFSWYYRKWTWTDLKYDFTRRDYFKQAPVPEEDRDGNTHAISLRQCFYFKNLLLKGRNSFFSVELTASEQDTHGASYDNGAIGGTVSLLQGLWFDTILHASWNYRNIRYDNPNVRSATGEKRDDDEQTIRLTVFKKLTDTVTAYAGYRHFKNDSNIPDYYEYTSSVYSMGLRFDY